jgi:glyoxalase family protein
MMSTNRIQRVTAIAGPARRNVDFYTRILGLRLVKKTVNFDDSSTYHLYFGDDTGRPGTILIFFPREHTASGRLGIGETQEMVFHVPEGKRNASPEAVGDERLTQKVHRRSVRCWQELSN